jgi:YggT family protein
MDVVLIPLLDLVSLLLNLYFYAVIGVVIVSWLIAFGILNTYNQAVSTILRFLARITDPFLVPLRRMLPDLGGIDLSPMILMLGIWLVQGMLFRFRLATGLL